jgi:hypothetical protein
MDRKEVAMKQTVETYKCDRCGEEKFFTEERGENITKWLNNDGWRRFSISAVPISAKGEGAIPFYGDLCRLCYADFSAFIHMERLDKDTLSTVE